MPKPQGAILTRDTATSPIKLKLWWHDVDLRDHPSVELSKSAALNLAIDLLMALRHEK